LAATETAEYAEQTTLQLPTSDMMQYQQQQQQQSSSDGQRSVTGSQTLLTSDVTSGAAGGGAVAATSTSADVVISIDEKQPLICRPDHILTIDTVVPAGCVGADFYIIVIFHHLFCSVAVEQ